jgi:hypothetical protein
MPTLLWGTVVRWEVDSDCEPPVVNYVDSETVTVYVADGPDGGDVSAIIGQYILNSDEDTKELLQAASDGLLQVIEIYRVNLKPPAVPPHKHKSKPEKKPKPKPEDKKPEDKKPEDKKLEDKKLEDKKP